MQDDVEQKTKHKQDGKGRPFYAGDPRINRKGRPRSFDALRELAQEIAHEKATRPDGEPIIMQGHVVTVAEAILRRWASSKDPRLQMAFIEIAFGKAPQAIEVSAAPPYVVAEELTDAELEYIAAGSGRGRIIDAASSSTEST